MRNAQRGAALIAMLVVLVLGAAWWTVSAISNPLNRTAEQRTHNAHVLVQAKLALIGYVAHRTLDATENNPGRLPCPEAAGFIGGPSEGIAAGNCTLPAVGRLPWRTLGLDKLRDASSEPLWYVVSPGWALSNSTVPPLTTVINSNTTGQLTLDARANVVALIIAPGAALSVQASANCTARNQARSAPAPTIDLRDYLECQNATSPADTTFASSRPGGSFNDQALAVTADELLPGIEAAIAKRIERDIVPQLKSVYATAEWGLNATNPLFPFAAPFANPGTSNFQGAAGTFQGLLPFNLTQGCSSDPRCLPALVAWAATPSNPVPICSGWSCQQSLSCTWESADVRRCDGEYKEHSSEPWRPIRFEMTATFTNVAMGLRVIDTTRMQVFARNDDGGPWQPQAVTYTATMNSNGSATITYGATLPNIDVMGWGTWAEFRFRLERSAIADHPLLTESEAATAWFSRNQWYRLLYYATAPNHAASGTAPRSCDETTPTCLQVTNVAPANKQRAIVLLAGRSLTGTARPNANLADFLDSAENRDGDSMFEQARISSSFNDRVIVLDENL